MTSDHISWDKTKRNIYTANEVSLLQPIYYRNNIYYKFLKYNDWVSGYLPNFVIPEMRKPTAKKVPLTSGLVDLIELATMKIQILYMKRKQTSETVSKNFIHFNIHDSSQYTLNKFDHSNV
jgi:hypothetical protein